jgi:hypothetical protein
MPDIAWAGLYDAQNPRVLSTLQPEVCPAERGKPRLHGHLGVVSYSIATSYTDQKPIHTPVNSYSAVTEHSPDAGCSLQTQAQLVVLSSA